MMGDSTMKLVLCPLFLLIASANLSAKTITVDISGVKPGPVERCKRRQRVAGGLGGWSESSLAGEFFVGFREACDRRRQRRWPRGA